MLDIEYSVITSDVIKSFDCINLYKTCDPPGRAHFWPKGHNLNKLGRGPLGDATYKISLLKASWFKTRRFFHIFPI